MENDRPPVQGVVGRTTGQIRLTVGENAKQTTIQPNVESATEMTTNFYTDESNAYLNIATTGRGHTTVCHSQHEWARDDGDGVGECTVTQWNGGNLDCPAQLPTPLPWCAQEEPGLACGNVRVGAQLETSHPRVCADVNGANLISPNSRYETEGFAGHRVPVILCA
jgi:hypothetical protein